MEEITAGTVSRYCKPSTLDENLSPTSSSFQLRKERDEKYLSVFLLDFFGREKEKEGVLDVKFFMENEIGFKFKEKGAFAILNIIQSKEYVFQLISEKISYKKLNLPHCGLFHEFDDLLISELLAQCVQNNYIVKDL
ncbi:Uncharacterized protein dnl_29820 [Desulfonema limicola]|uniref:Uncharacterized protein n=1 Tax=Desulfonema limicola TaxID=45656 RepID=A0A975B851_9BACT|nr:hypothetical protein [Desulfonema limicola]QTA80671.1 Uncharacterized protein dnl_29820 [Desulfonema limicola]